MRGRAGSGPAGVPKLRAQAAVGVAGVDPTSDGVTSGIGAASAVGLATTGPTYPLGLLAWTQKGFATANGGTTDPIDTSGATMLFAHVSLANGTTVSVTDNKGNSWHLYDAEDDAFTGFSGVAASQIYVCDNTPLTVGPGHTVSATGANTKASIQFSAWRSSTPWTIGQIQSDGGTLPHGAGGSVTTVGTNELVLTMVTSRGSPIVSVGSGFAIFGILPGDTNAYPSGVACRIYPTASASLDPIWTDVDGVRSAVQTITFQGGNWGDGIFGAGSATGTSTVSAEGVGTIPGASGLASGVGFASAGSDPATVFWQAAGTRIVKSNVGLDAEEVASAGYTTARASKPHTTGLWYCEIEVISGVGFNQAFGVSDDTTPAGSGLDVYNPAQCGGTRQDGFSFLNGFTAPGSALLGTVNVGTRIGLAIDCDHQELYLANNNSWIGSANPVTRTNPRIAWSGQAGINIYPWVSLQAGKVRIHASAATQTYAAPTGYTAWGDTPAVSTGVGSSSGHGTATGISPPPTGTRLVAHAEGYGGTTGGVTNSADTTGANILILHTTQFNVATVSDSKGNTWTLLGYTDNGSIRDYVYYVDSQTPLVGAGHTVTYGGSDTYSSAELLAFYIPGPWTFDEIGGVAGTTPTGPSLTTEQADELVISTAAGDGPGVSFISVTDGFTIITSGAGVGGFNFVTASAFKVQPSLATIQAIWTATSPNSAATQIFAFKPTIAVADTIGAALGTGAASGQGRSDARSVGVSAGTGTAISTGRADSYIIGNAAGLGEAVGIAEAGTTTGDATGTGSATGVGRSDKYGVSSTAGLGTATAVGRADFHAVGGAAGVGSAVGIAGAADIGAVGNAAGVGSAVGQAAAGAADGYATGLGIATGVGRADARADGVAAGSGTASGFSAASGRPPVIWLPPSQVPTRHDAVAPGALLTLAVSLLAGRATGEIVRSPEEIIRSSDATASGDLLVLTFEISVIGSASGFDAIKHDNEFMLMV
jgi:hypothetical protein